MTLVGFPSQYLSRSSVLLGIWGSQFPILGHKRRVSALLLFYLLRLNEGLLYSKALPSNILPPEDTQDLKLMLITIPLYRSCSWHFDRSVIKMSFCHEWCLLRSLVDDYSPSLGKHKTPTPYLTSIWDGKILRELVTGFSDLSTVISSTFHWSQCFRHFDISKF